MRKEKTVKRMFGITEELDNWVREQGKKKPFTTASAYVRAVLQADYDNFKERLSSNPKPPKKPK